MALLCLQLLPIPTDAKTNASRPTYQYLPAQTQSAQYMASAYQVPQRPVKFGSGGHSLRTFPLTQPLSTPISIYVDRNSRLYKEHYLNYIAESVDEWSNALNGRISYRFTNNPNAANIRVYWVQGFADPLAGGMATFKVGSAKLEIKTIGIPDREVKADIMHEFGHAFGINDHSPFQKDIMTGIRRWNRDPSYNPKLSSRDKDAIRLLYSPYWQSGEKLYTAADSANQPAYAATLPGTIGGPASK
jgi:hypothetical protein